MVAEVSDNIHAESFWCKRYTSQISNLHVLYPNLKKNTQGTKRNYFPQTPYSHLIPPPPRKREQKQKGNNNFAIKSYFLLIKYLYKYGSYLHKVIQVNTFTVCFAFSSFMRVYFLKYAKRMFGVYFSTQKILFIHLVLLSLWN